MTLRLSPRRILAFLIPNLMAVIFFFAGQTNSTAQPPARYIIRSSAENLQAYWKGDELIVGINIDFYGRIEIADDSIAPGSGLNESEKQKRVVHILVMKAGKVGQYELPVLQVGDDTVYPFDGTVYCITSDNTMEKLVDGSFEKTPGKKADGSSLWSDIINQPLLEQGWGIFSLWDEGPDEIEPLDKISESCKVRLTNGTYYLRREMFLENVDELAYQRRYFLVGTNNSSPVTFANSDDTFKQISQKEYEGIFKTNAH